jgi:DNA-binding response OmpR family regulator
MPDYSQRYPILKPLSCPHCGESLGETTDLVYGPLAFSRFDQKYFVKVSNSQITFTNTETTVLFGLAQANGRVLTRGALYDMLYWKGEGPEVNIFDVLLCKIRSKLRKGNIPLKIETIWGRGWALKKIEVDSTNENIHAAK